jgi:hypothetical protein
MQPRATDNDLFAESMPPWRLYFSLRGRISRRDFWLHGVLALIGLAVLAHALLGIARVREPTADLIVNALLLWPAATARAAGPSRASAHRAFRPSR